MSRSSTSVCLCVVVGCHVVRAKILLGPIPTDFLHFYHRHILTTDAECQVRLPGFKENTHDVNVVEFE